MGVQLTFREVHGALSLKWAACQARRLAGETANTIRDPVHVAGTVEAVDTEGSPAGSQGGRNPAL